MANIDFKVKNGINIQSPLPISMGGTGQTSANNTLNALLPVQTSNSGKYLYTDGTNASWASPPSSVSVTDGQAGTKIYVGTTTPGAPTTGDIWIDNAAAGNVFTTKGDIQAYSGSAIIRVGVGSDGQLLTADSTNQAGFAWKAAPVSLPSQTGNANLFLTTNGTSASWADPAINLQILNVMGAV